MAWGSWGNRVWVATQHQQRRWQAATSTDKAIKCPFAVLGVPKDASMECVRAAYHGLCKEHHPDVGGCETKFKEIKQAFDDCKSTIELGFDPRSYGDEEDASTQSKQEEDTSHFTAEDWMRRAATDAKTAEERDRKMRCMFRRRLEEAEDPSVLDRLLRDTLLSGCFAIHESGEPLGIALSRYHIQMGLGPEHVEKCFQAMDLWEHVGRRKVSAHFYHVLLTLYSNEAFLHHCDAMTVTETVGIILERMSEKGLPHDDWTIMLANRVFRQVPFPDW